LSVLLLVPSHYSQLQSLVCHRLSWRLSRRSTACNECGLAPCRLPECRLRSRDCLSWLAKRQSPNARASPFVVAAPHHSGSVTQVRCSLSKIHLLAVTSWYRLSRRSPWHIC